MYGLFNLVDSQKRVHGVLNRTLGEITGKKPLSPELKMNKRKKFTEVQKRLLACRQDYMCVGDICKNLQLLPCTWELDHIKPLFLHGTNDSDNLQIICPNCHAQKTQRELMTAADGRRVERLALMKKRIHRMKMHARKLKRNERISPYFNQNDPRFLAAIHGSIHTSIGISRLSRHRYNRI